MMKTFFKNALVLPIDIVSHQCGNCHYTFIIFDNAQGEEEWGILGHVDYCPRCGAVRGEKPIGEKQKETTNETQKG